MSDTDRLRQAATILRERAEAATAAPRGWRLGETPGGNEVWSDDASSWDARMVATTATRLNPNPGARGHADATFIATMHPGVALALSDWIEEEASLHEGEIAPQGRWCENFPHAASIAELINEATR